MKLVPLDIRQKEFSVTFKGYSKEEVLQFLNEVSNSFEKMIEDINNKDLKIKELKEEILEYKSLEKTLKKTMITAQQIRDDMKISSQKERDLIVAEAKMEANNILSEAKNNLIQHQREIDDLVRQKMMFKSELENLIKSHLKLLELHSDKN